MITEINESKMLTKHVSCECKCKFDGRKCNSDQKWNIDKCRCKCKKHHIYELEYIWNPATSSSKSNKYLASIIDDSVLTCDEIIEETKTIPINFNEKNITCKTKNIYKKYICFTCLFINCYSIIDSCWYFRLSNKISSKIKTLPSHITLC